MHENGTENMKAAADGSTVTSELVSTSTASGWQEDPINVGQ